MEIRRATIDDIPVIQAMADVAFRSTYARILSSEQMEYMMEWMYSTPSLTNQITAEGKDFFIAMDTDGTPIAYVSIEEEGTTAEGVPLMHLQKIYVMPGLHGQGVGKVLFAFVVDLLSHRYPRGCRIELNVNRENQAVHFYEKMGMRRDRQGDFAIGNGYYMNDYIYALDVAPRQESAGGDTYFRHFKGNYYKLLHTAYDSETTERMVVYQALYGERKIWVRPEKMFFEEIERDGKRMRRFEPVPECEVESLGLI